MDKTIMTIGYLMGRTIAGQRMGQKKQPVAYLYNGVRLPKLPEWDQEMYPYACIYRSVYPTSWVNLLCSSIPFVYSNGIVTTENEAHAVLNYLYMGTEPRWTLQTTSGEKPGAYGTETLPFWTDTDICSEGGEPYLEKSEPVPVYE